MSSTIRLRCAAAACVAALFWPMLAGGQEPRRSRVQLREPVHRIAKARVEPKGNIPGNSHPLDLALRVARKTLERIQTQVTDYSCTLVKRERIRGQLMNPEYMYTEVRNRKVQDGRLTAPFSVYMYFLKPTNIKGREVIYVEGNNSNKLVAHEGAGARVIVRRAAFMAAASVG